MNLYFRAVDIGAKDDSKDKCIAFPAATNMDGVFVEETGKCSQSLL